MRTLVIALLVLGTACLVHSHFSGWKKSRGFLTSLQKRLASRIQKDGKARLSRLGWFRTRQAGSGSDGIDEDAGDDDYLGSLNCRIWTTVCHARSSNTGNLRWLLIRYRLLSLGRGIWKAGKSTGVKWKNWYAWWKTILSATKKAMNSKLDEHCAEWKDKCNVDDGMEEEIEEDDAENTGGGTEGSQEQVFPGGRNLSKDSNGSSREKDSFETSTWGTS